MGILVQGRKMTQTRSARSKSQPTGTGRWSFRGLLGLAVLGITLQTPAAAASIPSAPQNLSASAGSGQVSLSWSAPSSNGGATITSYRVLRGEIDLEVWEETADYSITADKVFMRMQRLPHCRRTLVKSVLDRALRPAERCSILDSPGVLGPERVNRGGCV